MNFCSNLITTSCNRADFINWDDSVCFSPQNFLFLFFQPLGFHCICSFHFTMLLCYSGWCSAVVYVAFGAGFSTENWNASFANWGALTALTFAFWYPYQTRAFKFRITLMQRVASRTNRGICPQRWARWGKCWLSKLCVVMGGWNRAWNWKHLLGEWHSQHMFPSACQLFGNGELTNRLFISYREAFSIHCAAENELYAFWSRKMIKPTENMRPISCQCRFSSIAVGANLIAETLSTEQLSAWLIEVCPKSRAGNPLRALFTGYAPVMTLLR